MWRNEKMQPSPSTDLLSRGRSQQQRLADDSTSPPRLPDVRSARLDEHTRSTRTHASRHGTGLFFFFFTHALSWPRRRLRAAYNDDNNNNIIIVANAHAPEVHPRAFRWSRSGRSVGMSIIRGGRVWRSSAGGGVVVVHRTRLILFPVFRLFDSHPSKPPPRVSYV